MSKHSSRGARWDRLRLEVLERDEWRCVAGCGNWLENDHADPSHDATVDHIVAKVAGGRDEAANLVAMCRRCNGIKQDRAAMRVDWYSARWLPEGLAA